MVYLEFDYFMLFRCQHGTSVVLSETEEHQSSSTRSDQRFIQPRILPPAVASSRCSEQGAEGTGPVPGALPAVPPVVPKIRGSRTS